MSTQPQTQVTTPEETPITDESVARYLKAHPDFFEQHAALLTNLKLPHSTGGPAVSLVERQVSVLRQRNSMLERKLRELMTVARANDQLAHQLHTLSLSLMQASSMPTMVERLERGLREEFEANQITLVLFDDDWRFPGLDGYPFVRTTSASDASLKPLKTILAGARPRCGQPREAQREILFGRDNAHIGSAAMVPLGDNSDLGILAIGSREPTHFHPGMSTEFLGRLGDVVAVALTSHAMESAAA